MACCATNSATFITEHRKLLRVHCKHVCLCTITSAQRLCLALQGQVIRIEAAGCSVEEEVVLL